MSALGLAALAVAQADLAAGVRGGQPGRFQSPEVAERLLAVGLSRPDPWCAAEVFHCFAVASNEQFMPNPCPRTASAVHLYRLATTQVPFAAIAQLPAPGDVFVVEHADGIHGHCGIVEAVSPDGKTITTIEGDTNAEGSSTGDAMGWHTWCPADGKRGRLLGYLELGA